MKNVISQHFSVDFALNKIKTDSGLEEYAREELFMKKEDEEIFIIEFDSIND